MPIDPSQVQWDDAPPAALDPAAVVWDDAPKPLTAGQKAHDFGVGATGMTRGALNYVTDSKLGDFLFPKEGSTGSGYETAGQIADPLAWLVGGKVAQAAPYLKVKGKGLVEGAKALAGNLASGGLAGGAIGGATAEDAEAGAGRGSVIGALVNQTLPPVLQKAGKVIAGVAQRLSPEDRAANILREVAGDDLSAMVAASARAKPGETAAQSVSGIHNDMLAALDSLARRKDVESFFSKLDVQQREAMLGVLRQAAGGATQTAARQSVDAGRKALNTATAEARQVELDAANTAGKLLPKLQAVHDRLAGAASSKVGDVRRMEAAKALAEQRAQAGGMTLGGQPPTVPGQPRVPGRYSYADDLAQRAEGASQQAADDSLILGAGARDAQMRADSLAQHGLTPLDTGGVVARINGMLNSPRTGVSDINRKVLLTVRDKIEEWTTRGKGVIDAEALYEIRKSAINEAVEQLMGGASAQAKKSRAAGLLTELKGPLDDAIEAAGGTGWRKYLADYSAGAEKLTQQRTAGKALDLFERSPRRFERFAEGNEPAMVRKVTGDTYDVVDALGPHNSAVQSVAKEVARNRGIKEAAARGEGGLAEVLEGHTASFRIPNFLNPKITAANRTLEIVESMVNDKTMNAVYKAMRSGESLNQALTRVPTAERMKVVRALMSASQNTMAPTGAVIAATE